MDAPGLWPPDLYPMRHPASTRYTVGVGYTGAIELNSHPYSLTVVDGLHVASSLLAKGPEKLTPMRKNEDTKWEQDAESSFTCSLVLSKLSVLFTRSECEGPSWWDALGFAEREDGCVFVAVLTSGGTGSCYEKQERHSVSRVGALMWYMIYVFLVLSVIVKLHYPGEHPIFSTC